MPARIFSHGHDLAGVSLNALRAFEAAARHLSFTRAGLELSVTQTAISHQVKALEARLGVRLFRRTPRGLVLTDEGLALLPTLTDAFARIADRLGRFDRGGARETVTVSVVGTFLVGWLLERVPAFEREHPDIDLRLLSNNNRVEMAGESVDYAIRFGDGDWSGLDARAIMAAPLAPLCAPAVATRLATPRDLARETLLRSYRISDWAAWLAAAEVAGVLVRGPMFDSSTLMAHAAMRGAGVALAPPAMFAHELAMGSLVRPFAQAVDLGRYWLARLRSREISPAMSAFSRWLVAAAETK